MNQQDIEELPPEDAHNLRTNRISIKDITLKDITGIGLIIMIILTSYLFFKSQYIYTLISTIFEMALAGLQVILTITAKRPSLFWYLIRGKSKQAALYKELFLSYDETDHIYMEWIVSTLRNAGYKVEPFPLDADFLKEYPRRRAVGYDILVCSPAYMQSFDARSVHGRVLQKHIKGNSLKVDIHSANVNGRHVIKLDGLSEGEANRKLLAKTFKLFGKRAPLIKEDQTHRLFPGSGWNVPIELYTQPFEGRQAVLSQLQATFIDERAIGSMRPPQALTGLATCGKTRIAAAYAHENRTYYSYIFWIDAKDRDSIIDGFKHIALVVNPAILFNGQEVISDTGVLLVSELDFIHVVKNWLESIAAILVIFDGCDDHTQLKMQEFIPLQAKCDILLTTCARFIRFADRIPVTGLEPDDGADLFLKVAAPNQDDTNKKVVKAISEHVNGLPSALVSMGERVWESIETINGYSNLLFNPIVARDTRLKEYRNILGKPLGGLKGKSIGANWQTHFDCIQKSQSGAAKLLLFSSFLYPNRILRKLLFQIADVAGDDAMQELSLHSLIDVDTLPAGSISEETFININPLLQMWLQMFCMDDNQRLEMAKEVINTIIQACPAENDATFEMYISLAERCGDLLTEYNISSPAAAELLGKLGRFKAALGHNKAQHYLQSQAEMLSQLS